MPDISIQPSGKTISAAEGSRLLDALVNSGEKIQHKCDGQAQCGSCHIYIQEGRKSISKIQRGENEKLDSIVGVSSKSRLACQVMLGSENISVELLGFSS
jgi:2Fe-2S ferredoxin